MLNVESLGARLTPAKLAAGDLVIDGTSHADVVQVRTIIMKTEPLLQITVNGVSSSLWQRQITGRIVFNGGAGDDTFTMDGTKSVYVNGGAGNDSIRGGSGNDLLLGGDGDDKIDGGDGRDIIRGGRGADSLWGGDGDDYIAGDAGDDQLDGGYGKNELWGGIGNDHLFVPNSAVRNYLIGGTGNDTMVGGGRDYYQGGTGADTFVRPSSPLMVRSDLSNPPFTRSLPKGGGIADLNAMEGDVAIDSSIVRTPVL